MNSNVMQARSETAQRTKAVRSKGSQSKEAEHRKQLVKGKSAARPRNVDSVPQMVRQETMSM